MFCSSLRDSPPKKKPQLKRQMSVSQLVLQWCQEQTQAYEVKILHKISFMGAVCGADRMMYTHSNIILRTELKLRVCTKSIDSLV